MAMMVLNGRLVGLADTRPRDWHYEPRAGKRRVEYWLDCDEPPPAPGRCVDLPNRLTPAEAAQWIADRDRFERMPQVLIEMPRAPESHEGGR